MSILMLSDEMLTPGDEAVMMVEKASLPRRLVEEEPRLTVCVW